MKTNTCRPAPMAVRRMSMQALCTASRFLTRWDRLGPVLSPTESGARQVSVDTQIRPLRIAARDVDTGRELDVPARHEHRLG